MESLLSANIYSVDEGETAQFNMIYLVMTGSRNIYTKGKPTI